jgi:FixJ family two-component response regulator
MCGRHLRNANLTNIPLISIIDDDASFRRATTRLIKSLGHAVAAFSSAEEFLQSESLHDTVCLISDVQMPGMDGFELQNRLLSQGRRLPIIFISAYPESKAQGQALAAGAFGFLDKPFDDEKLISCLDQALAARSA